MITLFRRKTGAILPGMNTVKKILLEMFPVVLGVLLALLINNLNESVKEERKIQEIRTLIVAEISGNYIACLEFIQEQEVRNTFFEVYRDSLDVFAERGYFFMQLPFRGQRILSLNQTAWEAAQYSGILSSVEFDELQDLAGIYMRQQFLMDIQKQIVSGLYNQDVYNSALLKSAFNHIKLLNDDYMAFARSLLLNYEYFLNQYNSGN